MAIITVTLKDPDTMYDAVQDHVDEELKASNLPEDEQELVKDARVEKYSDILSPFFEYGEYLTVEFDTDTKTARVVPSSELEKARNA